MITATESTRSASPELSDPARKRRWEPYALAGIVLLALLLYGWNIGAEGWGNSFYSAAVRSMSQNWTNFFFGAFDPAGVITVDKPPMAFWPQVFSAWIFGYHGWALAIPQIVEGAAAVFLLHRTVRHWMGERTALLAALILTVTPVTVAIDRVNNPDALLTLLCVAAAYALTRALHAESSRSSTLWLSQAALWVGCGFVTKMLAGWMIIPAIGLAYLFGRKASWVRKVVDLAIATVVLLVSSLWWVALTALWPSPKPFVGGSDNGGAWNLIVGYNGFGRLFGENMPGMGGKGGGHRGMAGGGIPGGAGAPGGMPGGGGPGGPGGGGMNSLFGGETGVTRMFGESAGGQISWLLPLALLVLVVVIVSAIRRRNLSPTLRGGWILWGTWLVVIGAVFSTQQGIFHPYYTTQLAPAVAALSAAGMVVLWRYYRERGGYGWLLLPSAIALTAVWAWVLISRDTSWNGWLRYAVAAVALLAIIGLIIGRSTPALRRGGVILGIVAVLMAPALWSAAVPFSGSAMSGIPTAGPPGSAFGGGGRHLSGGKADTSGKAGKRGNQGMRGGMGGEQFTAGQRRILDYVTAHANGAQIVLAVEGGSHGADSYIINSTANVIGMGGFMGSDNAPSVQQLTEWKKENKLGFVLEPDTGKSGEQRRGGFGGMGNSAATARTDWVKRNCAEVPQNAYGGSTGQATAGPFGGGSQLLYRCTGESQG